GAAAKSQVPAIAAMLRKEMEETGAYKGADHVAGLFSALGGDGVPVLVHLIDDPKDAEHLRLWAISILERMAIDGRLGPKEIKMAVPSLVTALNDEDIRMHSPSVRTLGSIGTDAKAALPALITYFNTATGTGRVITAGAICKIDPKDQPRIE